MFIALSKDAIWFSCCPALNKISIQRSGSSASVSSEHGRIYEAISRVSIVVDKSSGIKIAASDSIITVSASGGTTSQDTAEEKLDCLGDSSLDIGFNYRYISEILANIDGDKVTMHHNSDDSQPVTFQPSSADNELYVLMPMRV